MTLTEKEAERVFENNKDIHLDLHSKIRNGKIKVDQAAIAGCAAGSLEHLRGRPDRKEDEPWSRNLPVQHLSGIPADHV